MPPDALIVGQTADAERAFFAGRHDEALELALALWDEGKRSSFRAFTIGRALRHLGRTEDALGWFGIAAGFPKVFPWLDYEWAFAEASAGQVSRASVRMGAFLEARADGTSLQAAGKRAVLDLAHRCFETDRPTAIQLYAAAQAAGFGDYFSELRIAEARTEAGALDDAAERFESLHARYQFDHWGWLSLSRLRQLRRQPDAARAAVLEAVAGGGDNPWVLITAATRLFELGAHAESEELLSRLAMVGRPAPLDRPARNLHLRLAAASPDPQGFRDLLAAMSPDTVAASEDALITCLFELLDRSGSETAPQWRAAADVAERLDALPDLTLNRTLALFHFFRSQRRWASVANLLDRAVLTDFADSRDVLLRRFEYACVINDMPLARALFPQLAAADKLSLWEGGAALRFLAQERRWTEAGEVLRGLIERGIPIPPPPLPLQVARKSRLREALLKLLLARPPAQAMPEGYADLKRLLIDDLCVSQGVSEIAFPGTPEPLIISVANAILVKPPSVRAHAPLPVLYFCTDKGYFFSVLTALASCAMAGEARAFRCRVAVFLDNGVPDPWRAALHQFARKLGLEAELCAEDVMGTDGVSVSERYGMFTGGVVLSRAAYFRLYAARHLLAKTKAKRLVYLDSDTIVRAPLRGLFEGEFGPAPITARPEDMTPEVLETSARHGIDPHTYFNSGVLVMDRGPDLGTRLDAAIRVSETEPERLVFHDQCALNVAFAGASNPLPSRWNHFLRPNRPDNGDLSSAAVLHFLDKPKPWDIAFQREYRGYWSAHAETVRHLLEPDMYRDMVAGSNGGP